MDHLQLPGGDRAWTTCSPGAWAQRVPVRAVGAGRRSVRADLYLGAVACVPWEQGRPSDL